MSKKIIIILLAVVLLGGAAGAVYFFVLRDNDSKQAELYEYALKDSFVTNVSGSSRLFKTTVVLVYDEKGQEKLLESKQYVIRDTVLFILRELTEEDIRGATVQDALRVRIPKALNEALGIESIVSVRFIDFVMQ